MNIWLVIHHNQSIEIQIAEIQYANWNKQTFTCIIVDKLQQESFYCLRRIFWKTFRDALKSKIHSFWDADGSFFGYSISDMRDPASHVNQFGPVVFLRPIHYPEIPSLGTKDPQS